MSTPSGAAAEPANELEIGAQDALNREFEALPIALMMVDGRGRIIRTNPPLDQLFGYQEQELLGSLVEVLLPLSDRLAHPELREAYLQLPQKRAMAPNRELTGLSKSGRSIPVEVYLHSVEVDGNVMIVAAIVDVGRMADKLNRSRQALDAASSAMVMVDEDGVIVLVNAKVGELFGYEREQLIGSSIEMLIPTELRRRHEVYRRSYGADPEERKMETGRDLNGRRADGSEFPLEVGLMPIEGLGDRYFMATVIDTSERRRAELVIEQRNAELIRANAELEQVAHSASHDLKAPLTTLDGLLGCVVDDLASGDHEAVLLNVERSQMLARRLGRLIEGILGLAGPGQNDREMIDLGRMVHLSIAALEGTFADHDVSVTADVPSCQFLMSPIRLSQIVQNLLSNAAKFSDPAKPDRHVSITAEVSESTVTLVIADNGIGIPHGQEEAVFADYRQVDNHVQPGTGLGLALVKRHVDQMEGTISYRSSPDGTTFRVVLPANIADVAMTEPTTVRSES